ncbi:MAG: hypothetical protein LKI39_03700 [Bacteroides sp.]|jgi:hypothetical protein|nr:hypothetical protein [Bacteroides sp.]
MLDAKLVKRTDDYILNANDAESIFNVLTQVNADSINKFRISINGRYQLRDYQTPASYEYLFIKKMLELIENKLNQENNRKISYIPFALMKKNLLECIDSFQLDK